MERLAHKDQRMRTFIASDATRRDLVLHVYDVTRDLVPPGSTLVMLDDSIVRGTTLRESIVAILDRLEPARILFVSSAPQIRYPDCYGIDMSQLGRFVARSGPPSRSWKNMENPSSWKKLKWPAGNNWPATPMHR